MNYIELFLDDNQVDLSSDEYPQIELNGINIEDPMKQQNDLSFHFTLPYTVDNNRLFSALAQPATLGVFNTTQKYKAKLYVNTSLIFEGFFIYERSTPKGYEGFLRGNRLGWVDSAKSLKLPQIEGLTMPFEGGQTILNRWNAVVQPQPNNALCTFAPIGYGKWFNIPTTTGTGPYTTTYAEKGEICSVYSTLGGPITTNNVMFEDFPPQVFVKSIVEKGFNQAGYSVSGSFFQSSLTDVLTLAYGGKSYIWNWNRLLSSNHYQTPLTNLCQLTGTNPFGTFTRNTIADDVYFSSGGANINRYVWQPTFDLVDYNYTFQFDDTEGEYTCKTDGTYSMTAEFDLTDINMYYFPLQGPSTVSPWLDTIPNGPRHLFALIVKNYDTAISMLGADGQLSYGPLPTTPIGGVQPVPTPSGRGVTQIMAYKAITPTTASEIASETDVFAGVGLGQWARKTLQRTNPTITLQTGPMKLKKGDKLRFAFFWSQRQNNLGDPRPSFFGIDFNTDNLQTKVVCEGDYDLNLAKNLPNITFLDFMKDLTTIYNLRFAVSDNTVFIDNFDNSLSILEQGVELTNYVDEQDFEKYDTQPSRQNIFSYEQDSNDSNDTTDSYTEIIFRPTNEATVQEYKVAKIVQTSQTYDYYRTLTYTDTNGLVQNPAIVVTMPFIADKQWVDLTTTTESDKYGWLKILPGRSYDITSRLLRFDQIKQNQEYQDPQSSIYFGAFYFHQWDQTAPMGSRDLFIEQPNYEQLVLNTTTQFNVQKYWNSFIEHMRSSHWIRVRTVIPFYVFRQLDAQKPILIQGIPYILKKAQGYNTVREKSEINLEILRRI